MPWSFYKFVENCHDKNSLLCDFLFMDTVYVPRANYLPQALKTMPMFHDAEMAEKLGLEEDTFILP